MFDPKQGDEVLVCYDGKLGRRVLGRVLKRRGFAIFVEFTEWGGENKLIRNWFVRTSPKSFGGFVRDLDFSLMKALYDLPGDWYSVYSYDTLIPRT